MLKWGLRFHYKHNYCVFLWAIKLPHIPHILWRLIKNNEHHYKKDLFIPPTYNISKKLTLHMTIQKCLDTWWCIWYLILEGWVGHYGNQPFGYYVNHLFIKKNKSSLWRSNYCARPSLFTQNSKNEHLHFYPTQMDSLIIHQTLSVHDILLELIKFLKFIFWHCVTWFWEM